jgi:hypothetical protein
LGKYIVSNPPTTAGAVGMTSNSMANTYTPSPSTQFLQQSTVPKVVRQDGNKGMGEHAMINKNTIAISLMTGGRNHCGGDFVLPHLQLQQDKMEGRMPLFVMAPGSIVAFPGANLYHCTTEHDSVERYPENCKAHISFAVQTPSPILGQKKTTLISYTLSCWRLGELMVHNIGRVLCGYQSGAWTARQTLSPKQISLLKQTKMSCLCLGGVGLFSLMPTLDKTPHWFL